MHYKCKYDIDVGDVDFHYAERGCEVDDNHGAFSNVYHREVSDTVVKLTSDDHGYQHFVDLVSQGMLSGPHIPKIYCHYYCGGGDSITIIERLEPFRHYMLADALERAIDGINYAGDCYDAYDYGDYERFLERVIDEYNNPEEEGGGYETSYHDEIVELISYSLFQTIMEVIDYQSDLTIDLHSGNFMLRDGREVVIIDPYCN
jgi:hypothetical protein